MSILSDFTRAAHSLAQSIIGGETLTIRGGSAVTGTASEVTSSRDYEEGGFEGLSMLDFVIDATDFSTAYPAAISSYQGKTATARGETWRVATIKKGAFFVTVSLVSTNKSA